PHLVNVALHAANVVLLLLLLVRTTDAVAPSIVVAALFALHPLRVESVAWVAERKDVLSVCIALVTLHAWVDYVRRPSVARYSGAFAGAALALAAKPMLVTLPALLFLFDCWPIRRSTVAAERGRIATLGRLVLEKIPFLGLTVGVAAVTLRSVRAEGGLVALA